MTSAIAWMVKQPEIKTAERPALLRRGRKHALPPDDYAVIEALLLYPERLTAGEIALMWDVPIKQVYRCRERMRKGLQVVPPAAYYIRAQVVHKPYDRCTQLRKIISEGASVSQAAQVLGVSVGFVRRVLREKLHTTVAELQQTRLDLITLVRKRGMTVKAACKHLKISLWRGHRLLAANYDRKTQ